MTKVLTLSILFSTAVEAVAVVILGILFLTLFILALKAIVVAKLVILGISFLTSFILGSFISSVSSKLVISGILSSVFLILALYTSFLTTSFFTILSLLNSTRRGTNLPTSNLSTLRFKLFKSVGIFFQFIYI